MEEWMIGECSIDMVMEEAAAKNMFKDNECDKAESRKVPGNTDASNVEHSGVKHAYWT